MKAVGIAAAFALLVPAAGAAARTPADSAAIRPWDQERAPPRHP
ncbi:MAG: hypothetical protein ABW277_00245 [Longimicrobiaceae bacterium]